MARDQARDAKLWENLAKICGERFYNGMFIFRHFNDTKDKMLLHIVGTNKKGRVEFNAFRIYPEIEASRSVLTIKQFTKRFKEYEVIFICYQTDKEWKKFLDSAYFQHLYQKLL